MRHAKKLRQDRKKKIADKSKKKDLINRLSDDCLAQIFMYIPLLERLELENVCAKWKRASELAWYDIKEFSSNKYFKNADFANAMIEIILSRCGPYLKNLSLEDWYFSNAVTTLPLINKYCHNISKLNLYLDMENIHEEHLIQAFSELQELKFIRIVLVGLTNSGIHGLFFNSLAADIEEIEFITRNEGISLSKKFPFLLLESKFIALRCLSLENWSLDEDAMKELTRVKTLTYLKLDHCILLNNGARFISNLVNLQHFNFSNSTINQSNFIKNIAEKCKFLKYFEISQHESFTDFPINHDLVELTNCENLEELNLYGSSNVNGFLIKSIGKKCKKIKDLVLQCETLSSFDLKQLDNFKNLKNLTIQHLTNFDRSLIGSIAFFLNSLKYLDLGFANVSKYILRELAMYLNNVEVLHMNDIMNASNDMFIHMKKLRTLNCMGCDNVTDLGLMRVIKNCPDIKLMNVFSTGVTVDTLNFANDETKKRTNNVTLSLVILNRKLKNDFGTPPDISPFLKII